MILRCSERWQNIPSIQLYTDPNWWGNYFLDTQVGGLFASASDEPIKADGESLKTLNAYVKKDLAYLVDSGIASEITTTVTNPEGEQVLVSIVVQPVYEKLSIVPFKEYNKPEIVEFWLSTLGGTPLIQSTLGDATTVQSNLGGITT